MAAVGQLTFEDFVKAATAAGLTDVTKEEYEAKVRARPWSLVSAIQMIKTARKGVVKGKERNVLVGYPLGGRDFAGKGQEIEVAKGQRVTFLTADGRLLELTEWGSFTGRNGTKCEIEVEASSREGQAGQRWESLTVKSVTIHDGKVEPSKLLKLSRDPTSIVADDLYKVVVLRGWIGKDFGRYPKFGEGEDGSFGKTGDWPHVHEGEPVLSFYLGPVRIGIPPRKNSNKYLVVRDLAEIASVNDTQVLGEALHDRSVVVVGVIRRFVARQDGGAYIDMDATAVVEVDGDDLLALNDKVAAEAVEADKTPEDRFEEGILAYLADHPNGAPFEKLMERGAKYVADKGLAEEILNLMQDKGLIHEPVIGTLKATDPALAAKLAMSLSRRAMPPPVSEVELARAESVPPGRGGPGSAPAPAPTPTPYAPKPAVSADAAAMVAKVREIVDRAAPILGAGLTVQAVKVLYPEALAGVSDEVLAKVIEKRKAKGG